MGCCHSDNRPQRVVTQVAPKQVKTYGNDPSPHMMEKQLVQKQVSVQSVPQSQKYSVPPPQIEKQQYFDPNLIDQKDEEEFIAIPKNQQVDDEVQNDLANKNAFQPKYESINMVEELSTYDMLQNQKAPLFQKIEAENKFVQKRNSNLMLFSVKQDQNFVSQAPIKDDLEIVEDRFVYQQKKIDEEYLKECKASENSEFE